MLANGGEEQQDPETLMMQSKQIPFILFLLIALLTRLFFYYDARHIYKSGEEYAKTYSLRHEPKKNDTSQYFFLDGILVSLPLYPSYGYGDTLEISGTITTSENDRGELLILKKPHVIKKESSNFFTGVTKFIRERITGTVTMMLPQKEAGLLLGIILGVRDKIDSDFYKDLRGAGVLHVIAASGQNVSILASVLLISLQKIVKRRYALLFTAIAILTYSTVSGFDPPILRASIMALISYGALLFGRQTSGVLALLLTGWGMVIFSPSLLEDVSFQLSFLATSGILLIKPLVDKGIRFNILGFIKEDLGTTISAQMATLPLILGVFGSYSLMSFPVNILVLWTVPILMITGGIGVLLSLVNSYLAAPFVLLSYPFLAYFRLVVEVSSRFDSFISIETLPQALIFGYYLILFGIVLGLKKRERRKI